MKTAKITAVHQVAHHQYGSQGETVYNVTLDNGWTGWIVGFGADHRPTMDKSVINEFTDHQPPTDECDMIGTVVEIDWTTRAATIAVESVGRGHYRWTVRLEDNQHTLTDSDSRSYDEIHGAETGDPEAIAAKLRKIEQVIEANGMTYWGVRHSSHPRWGDEFEADVAE